VVQTPSLGDGYLGGVLKMGELCGPACYSVRGGTLWLLVFQWKADPTFVRFLDSREVVALTQDNIV
jgi:hypothetical protein